jgi:uncharacterized protein
MKPCPICQKPNTEKFRPFCSVRCADIDLHKWLSESYAIPVKATESDDALDEDPQNPPETTE